MSTLIVSASPLSKSYRLQMTLRLPEDFSSQQVITISELRQAGFGSLIRSLRAQQRIIFAYEDQDSSALKNIMMLLGCALPMRDVAILDHQLILTSVTWPQRLIAASKLLWLSIGNLFTLFCAFMHILWPSRNRELTLRDSDFEDVAFLNANAWFGVKVGGSIGHVAGVVNGIKMHNKRVTFYGYGTNPEIRESIKQVVVPFSGGWGMPSEFNYYRLGRSFTRYLHGLFKKERPTILYQRLSICNFSGVLLAKKFGIPLVVEYNGSEVWIAKNWGKPLKSHWLADRVEQYMLHYADRVVTISEPLKQELIDKGVSESRIVCYPNCVDEQKFSVDRFSKQDVSALRNEWSIPLDATLVTFVGTFGVWHGAENLARALVELYTSNSSWLESSRLHFLFVGDGVKMPKVKRILEKQECSNYYTITGLVPQNKAPLFLAASDILVSPHVPNTDGSTFFGSPTKLFEYMAMRKVIIASDLDQIGEVLKNSLRVFDVGFSDSLSDLDGQLSLLVKPGDVNSLVKAIQFASENLAGLKKLAISAESEVKSKYLWEHHVAHIMGIGGRSE